MKIEDINTAIMRGNFTNDQLTSIGDAVRYARARITDGVKRDLYNGCEVTFKDSRTGLTVRGNVRKIAIKYVIVATPTGFQWRVPASMLTIVEKAADPLDDFNYVGSRHHY